MSTEPKRIYRSRTNRMIGGVCGGVGQYFNIDPTLIRILFIILVFLWGGGLILYLIMWILVPEEPKPAEITSEDEGNSGG